MSGNARYCCPGCQYSSNNPKRLDEHKRRLGHDGNTRRASRVGMQTMGGKGSKGKGK